MAKYLPEAYCAICGDEKVIRSMNKLMISFGHSSVTHPKNICYICDDCLPSVFDYLGVKEPDRNINWEKNQREGRK